MELEYKTDFESARNRWTDFWNGTNQRPMLYVVLPKRGVDPAPKPSSYECTFGNIDRHIDRVIAWMETHDFLLDAIPAFRVDFASDHFAALLGCDLKGDPDNYSTVWAEKCISSWSSADIKFDPNSFWWQRTCEVIERFRQRTDGRFLLSGLTPASNLDALSAMRGAQELLIDMVMEPETVKEALQQIEKCREEVQAALALELDQPLTGRVTRHGIYCNGYIDAIQCDFSVMISPEMYQEFVLPLVTNHAQGLDVAYYHLDGEDAVRHLDMIASVDEIRLIQWVPGAGAPSMKNWDALRERFDALGLGQLDGGNPEHIKSTWQSRNSRCLVYHPDVGSHDEALRLADELYTLGKVS